MTAAVPTPCVYILHGEDEYSIARFVSEQEGKLGDSTIADMNLSRLDGRSFDLNQLPSITSAMPFLADRRVVIVTNFLARLNSPSARENLKNLLAQVPPSTLLLLVEHKPLLDERDRKKGKQHWLEKWAAGQGGKVQVKAFPAPKGAALNGWIQEQAKRCSGQISPPAAALLAGLTGGDLRLAAQELDKLLAYVDWKRPVEPEDVEAITPDSSPGDIFVLVDALGGRDARRALAMLHRLLESEDAFMIFGMVIRQFRLLLLTREILDQGGRVEDVVRRAGMAPFVAEKLAPQARRFTLPALERIYHRLLEVDEAVKTGQMSAELALDTLVASFG